MKKICSFFICIIIIFSTIHVSSADPRWTNTYWVYLYHKNIDGDAYCEVEIQALTGTTRIDNVDIKLYLSYQEVLVLVKRWDNLYVNGPLFEFNDIVEDIEPGLTYRLILTADVHRNGTVESIESYLDAEY